MNRTLFTAGLLFITTALGQQGPATTSSLTRIPLTAGAVRVTEVTVTWEFGQVLNDLAKDQNTARQTSEYLVWGDPDQAEQVSENLARQFQARGMTLKVTDEQEDEDVSTLSFLPTDKQNRYVGLLYGDAESVALGWCQLKAAGAVPKVQPPAATSPAAPQTAPTIQAPPASRYTCLRFLASGNEVANDLRLLAGGRYTVSGTSGAYTFEAKTRTLTWTSGPFATTKTNWVGVFETPKASPATIRLRDRKDIQAGNLRDLQWCNLVR